MKSRLRLTHLVPIATLLAVGLMIQQPDQRLLAADPPAVPRAGSSVSAAPGNQSPSLADESQAFRAAVRRGDIDEVWRRSKANRLLVHGRDAKTGVTPIVEAIDQGDVGMVRLLLDMGAIVDGRNEDALLRAAAIVTSEYFCDGHGPLPRMEAFGRLFQGPDRGRQAAARGVLKEYRGLMALPPKAEAARLEILRLVIAAGGNVKGQVGGELTPPIFTAVMFSNYKAVEVLLEKGASANVALAGGTPLHVAATFGPVEVVKVLLAHQAEVNAANQSNGKRALHLAAAVGNTDIIRVLLEAGAKPDLVDFHGCSTLHLAVWSDDIFNLLLARGADPKLESSDGMTSLHMASQVGSRAVVERLLALGGEINARDAAGFTPLLCAAETGRRDIVKLLVERGADITIRNHKGRSAVYLAAGTDDPELLQLLLERRRADADSEDMDGVTPLMNAAGGGRMENVRRLIQAGGRVKGAPSRLGMTTLMFAAMGPRLLLESAEREGTAGRPGTAEDYLRIAELLIGRGGSVTAADAEGRTALHHAAMGGNEPMIRLLMAKGAGMEVKETRAGQTPLFHAVKGGDVKTVKTLVGLGAKVDVRDRDSSQPIHWAARDGRAELIKILIAHGASPTVAERHGGTPLHIAVMEGKTDTARVLLEHGASVLAVDQDKSTPLHLAAAKGFVELTRLLLAHGAPVNAPNSTGNTPLHFAAAARIQAEDLRAGVVSGHGAGFSGFVKAINQSNPDDRLAIITLLLEKGANRQAKDVSGATPLDFARKLGTPDVVRLIESGVPCD